MFRRCFSLLLLSATLVAAADVRAENAADKDAARQLFVDGRALAEQKQWNEARIRFERALALKRSPLILYNLAVTYQELGRIVEALEFFRAFLAEMQPNNVQHKEVEQPARDSVAALEKRVAKLDITVLPDDVENLSLTIDGIIVPEAAWGYPRLVDPGEHKVIARADGYRETMQLARVTEGQTLPVTIDLDPLTGPAKDRGKGKNTGPDKPNVPILQTSLLAGGATAFAVGLTVGLVGVQKASDSPTRDGKAADGARRLALTGDVIAGVGIAAAGTGLTLLLLDKFGKPNRRQGKPASTWVMPVVGPTGAGVVGQF